MLWDAVTGQKNGSFLTSCVEGAVLAWSPVGRSLAIGALKAKKGVEVWDTERFKKVVSLEVSDSVRCLAWSHDGATLAVSEWPEGQFAKLELFDRAGGKAVRVIEGPRAGTPEDCLVILREAGHGRSWAFNHTYGFPARAVK